MNRQIILLSIFILLNFVACKDKNTQKVERIVSEWMGKTIQIPNIKSSYVSIKDSIKYISKTKTNTNKNKYKILLYIDSVGCMDCKLRLHIWKTYIEDFHSRIDFLFYFQPNNEEILLSLLKRERINYPVFIDKTGELNKLNNFPDNSMFQCFLLDKDNTVIAIGNPANNYNVWELYKKIITE
jgi:hypothetical protein